MRLTSAPNLTTATITSVRWVCETFCDVCAKEFCDGDQVCAYSVDPKLPEPWLSRVSWGIWVKQISYHTHERCMKIGGLH